MAPTTPDPRYQIGRWLMGSGLHYAVVDTTTDLEVSDSRGQLITRDHKQAQAWADALNADTTPLTPTDALTELQAAVQTYLDQPTSAPARDQLARHLQSITTRVNAGQENDRG